MRLRALLPLLAIPALNAQPRFNPELERYLELTAAQVDQLVRSSQDLDRSLATRQRRTADIQNELAAERRKPTLDPLAFGDRYAEIEMLRRGAIEDQAEWRKRNRAVLNATQTARLPALEASRHSEHLQSEAACAGLLERPPQIASFIIRDPLGAGFCASSVPLALRLYLDLTDAQARAISDLLSSHQRSVLATETRIRQVETEISQETAREPIDPSALGVRYVEIEHLRREIAAAASTVREKAKAELSPAQNARLAIVQASAGLAPVTAAAECEGLIDPRSLPDGLFARPSPLFISPRCTTGGLVLVLLPSAP
ncbi:MAG: periplasmic heavy metal sensor [Acidobacteria bacterium]|nr:periplasmic heavy metal sensor [Acidobacteriota bacterium]